MILTKKTPEHDKIQKWVYKNVRKVLDELPILKGNKYEVTRRVLEHVLRTETNQYQRQSSVVGFVDLSVHVQGEKHVYKLETSSVDIYFEIKTAIPSLGELIRQLRFYKENIAWYESLIVVVSPDDQHKQILNEQGFFFYKYQDESKLF